MPVAAAGRRTYNALRSPATRRGITTDRHLNLFYSYNRDNELIENNLTRAFVVTLSLLSGGTRQTVLTRLLAGGSSPNAPTEDEETLDYTRASFALQSHMARGLASAARRKLLLTLSTEPLAAPSSIVGGIAEGSVPDRGPTPFRSVPDGWVFAEDGGFCILIESKVGANPLDPGQLRCHVRDWFLGGRGTAARDVSVCSRTWTDVLVALEGSTAAQTPATVQDRALAGHLAQFIGHCGYRLFRGFDFGQLPAAPDLAILELLRHGAVGDRLQFSNLSPSPGLRIAVRTTSRESSEP